MGDPARPPRPPGAPRAQDPAAPAAPSPSKPSAALVVALGDVRDGVAAIEAFVEALGSRRVGPRVLASNVPDVRRGCAPLRAAIDAFEQAIAVPLGDDAAARDAVKAMLDHAALRVTEIEKTLAAREDGAPIDARERLAIEAVVRPGARELDAAVRLADLLVAAITPQSTWIDIGEVLDERQAAAASQIAARLVLPASIVVVHDPRLLRDLFEFAVATVARAGVKEPQIAASRDADGLLVAKVGAGLAAPPRRAPDKRRAPAPPPPRVLHVALRPELPREPDVVRAASRRAGFDLRISGDGREVTLQQLPGAT